MLGLRLDEPLTLDAALENALDDDALEGLARRGLVDVTPRDGKARSIQLTQRARPLGGGVTVELLA
jgi:hypothetical protein